MRKITALYNDFFKSERTGGLILIASTIISILIANSPVGESYLHLWHARIDASLPGLPLNLSVEQWINDGLMTVFFLLVGLEIQRELYKGELQSFRHAVLPIMAAVGGMAVPALIHFFLNWGTDSQKGIGIPMATDIAFALGVLSLLGNRVPPAIKIFLTALAIIDDLGAVVVIAIFYTANFSLYYFSIAMGIFGVLMLLNKFGVRNLLFYLLPGVAMWYCMMQSGVHATVSGVLLAFTIPFVENDQENPAYKLQHWLHKPVAFCILPLFALSNTGLVLTSESHRSLLSRNSLGIILGLFIGKPIGILLFCYLAVKTRISSLPHRVNFKLILGTGILGGIGFTMSIFITNLAFADNGYVQSSKIAVLFASLCAGIAGLIYLRSNLRQGKEKKPAYTTTL